MKNMIPRLLIFFIGVPLIIALVLLLPQFNHLCISVVVVVASALASVELAEMLGTKGLRISGIEAGIFGALAPAATVAVINFYASFWFIPLLVFAAISWILIALVLLPMQEQDSIISRLAARLVVLIYPGAFLAWICGMGKWSGEIILLFLLIPMANDGTAWAAGMLFGKGNRGIVPVSPNKSIAGFVGGLLASVLAGALAALFLPGIFKPRFLSPVLAGSLLGLVTGIFANLGDLCESAIKRSAGYKDSGKMFPGRGGMLDSVDSIAMAAPAFYFAFKILFFLG